MPGAQPTLPGRLSQAGAIAGVSFR